MHTINVRLKQNSYPIVIGKNILSTVGIQLKQLYLGSDAIIITNPLVYKLHGQTLVAGLKRAGFTVKVFTVPDAETSKSAKEAMKLMERMARYDVLRKPFIIAFGGGVVGDLAGFVAAVYKRGIAYVQVPTTFLAQIDSAIGGKVAIDLSSGKNYVGAFYQPKIVYSDISVLATLPKRQLINGMAEAIKYGVINDPRLFGYIEKNYKKLIAGDLKCLLALVLQSSRIKAKVVMADEKETKGIRTVLNFGHTIGHAIETAGRYKIYQHGEAIALGMRVAIDISVQLKMLDQSRAKRINTLLSAVGLPERIKRVNVSQIMRLMKGDKKFVSGKNRFVLALKIGKVRVIEGVNDAVIKKAILKFIA